MDVIRELPRASVVTAAIVGLSTVAVSPGVDHLAITGFLCNSNSDIPIFYYMYFLFDKLIFY